jgi:uncharacterized repeat protein (TIGR03803 family)
MRSKKPFSAGKTAFVILMALLLASAIVPTQAQARKFKVLHTFHGPNGYAPAGVLTRDMAGNLYGTTEGGGTGKCTTSGCGTAFKLDKNGKQIWLHSFQGSNGLIPNAGLLRDAAGNLFGTTVEGGKSTKVCGGIQSGGCGVVFKLDKAGAETVLHKFTGDPDGYGPESLLVQDSAGDLYGTTYLGGKHGYGAVFKVDKSDKETVLYSFVGTPDGSGPYPGVIRDAAGNLYGVTFDGGTGTACDFGCGTVFEVDTTGKETILHNFDGGADGAGPDSVLIADRAGNLYGTTTAGGNAECGGTGCGTVFELSPQSDGSWKGTVLYAFCSLSGCTDGERPLAGPLVRDPAGNLYGTTYFGGASQNCNGVGCGTIFKLDTGGKETVLHSFTDRIDGGFPVAGLIRDAAGTLYGTASGGGDASCINGCGTVFRIVP